MARSTIAFDLTTNARAHKVLDMIGDLSIAGVELIGRFTSFRGGHQLNGQMAQQLARLAGDQSHSSTTDTWKAA